ncbi:hypothetical protein HYN24_04865 [Dechloromonas sp. HYN0024]|nr:hypothetical protein HYN24_04865 [Dechloromonas sp. HYN0024]
MGWWLIQPITHRSASPHRLEVILAGQHSTTTLKPKSDQAPIQSTKASTEPAAETASSEMPQWIPVPNAPDETYLAPEHVEKLAYVIDVEELPLPATTNIPGGAVYLKVLINESGRADKVDVLTSTLPEPYAATLVSAFSQARFSPALVAGLPVKSWRIIEIRFDLPEPAAG